MCNVSYVVSFYCAHLLAAYCRLNLTHYYIIFVLYIIRFTVYRISAVTVKQDIEERKSQQFELHRQQVLYNHAID